MPADLDAQLGDLKKQIAEMRPGPKNQLSMIVFSGDLDKLLAAMTIATGAASTGMRVVLFFTFWGTAALRNPRAHASGKDFMATMFGWMLPKGRNAVKLSHLHLAGLGTAMMNRLMKKKHAPTLDQLFEMAAQLEVEIKICELSMNLMGFRREEMIAYPKLQYCGVATFLEEARESSIQLFV